MTTGERIRKARKEAGLTQKQLGEKIGVSGAMIGQYETGVRNPKQEMIEKISGALGIQAESLRGYTFVFSHGGYPERDSFRSMLNDVFDYMASRATEDSLKSIIDEFIERLDTEGKRELLKKALELYFESDDCKKEAKKNPSHIEVAAIEMEEEERAKSVLKAFINSQRKGESDA